MTVFPRKVGILLEQSSENLDPIWTRAVKISSIWSKY